MGSSKSAKSIRPKRRNVSRSIERPAYRKARDERIALQLLGVKAAATMVRDASASSMLHVHVERHILVPLTACIMVLSPETGDYHPRRKGGVR
jgi:hypothetical protein